AVDAVNGAGLAGLAADVAAVGDVEIAAPVRLEVVEELRRCREGSGGGKHLPLAVRRHLEYARLVRHVKILAYHGQPLGVVHAAGEDPHLAVGVDDADATVAID